MAYGSTILKSEKKIFEIKNVWNKIFCNFYVVSKKDARDLSSVKNSKKYGYRADNGFRVRKIHNLVSVPLCDFFSGTDLYENNKNIGLNIST